MYWPQHSIFHLIKRNHIENLDVSETELPNDEIVLGYLGSINSLVDIDSICGVITEIRKHKPVIVEIIGAGVNTEKFISELKNAGAVVHYHGAVFEENAKYQILKKCHFGINIYKNNLQIGLTAKSVDYFNYGLPILNSIQGDTHVLVEEYGVGVNIENINVQIDKVINYGFSKHDVIEIFNQLFNDETVKSRLQFLDSLI